MGGGVAGKGRIAWSEEGGGRGASEKGAMRHEFVELRLRGRTGEI